MTVVYDNNPDKQGLATDWGFACVVRGLEKTILFDTGAKGELLLRNMKKLDVTPGEIDAVVLSHIHGDHVGGLDEFLERNSDVTVVLPAAFPTRFKLRVRRAGAKIVQTLAPHEVCPGARTTRVLGGGIREQGLCVQTPEGPLVITGCAHPGVVAITKAAVLDRKQPVRAVLGGFHMRHAPRREIAGVIRALAKLGVRKAGPCHCSGDETRAMMKKAFGGGYLSVGVGSEIRFAESEDEADDQPVGD